MQHEVRWTPGERAVMLARPTSEAWLAWARRCVVVPDGPQQGAAYDPDLTPFWPPLWSWLSKPWVRNLVVVGAPQTGKTMFYLVFLLRRASERPGVRMIALPDQDQQERLFRIKLLPMVQRSPKLRAMLGASRYAMSDAEVALGNGSIIMGSWAGSPSKRASISVLDMCKDEPDLYPAGASDDYDERCRSYDGLYKILGIGKPQGGEGESRSWAALLGCDIVLRFEARCPACMEYQPMEFGQIKVPEGMRSVRTIKARKLAWYECACCGNRWSDARRDRAVAMGRWRPYRRDKETRRWQAVDQGDVPDRPQSVGAHLPSWYSTFVSLSDVIGDWFAAQGKQDKLKSWWNGHAAEPFDAVVAETDEEALARLIVPDWPLRQLPDWTTAVTVSVDMQSNHFWASTCAHGVVLGEDVTRYRFAIVDPVKLGDWGDLASYVFDARWRLAGTDRELGVWRAALDTGGGKHGWQDKSRPVQAYQFLLKHKGRGILWGTKGASRKRPGHAIWFNMLEKYPSGQKMRGAMRLYFLDTDLFKGQFLAMTDLDDEGEREGAGAASDELLFAPLVAHMRDADRLRAEGHGWEEYFRQLLGEKQIMEKGRVVWKRVRANHYLDCMVGHLAMAHWQWAPSLERLARMLAAPPVMMPKKNKPAKQERRQRW